MSNIVIEKLFGSLDSLQAAIKETKAAISSLSTPRPEIIQRLECYEEVLVKQKTLAATLFEHVEQGNWEQVSRHVELIRGSSLLIQLDTQAIITELAKDGDSSSNNECSN
jgi:hypothetical protein